MNKDIKKFLALVSRANLKRDTEVRLSINDANSLHTAISNLLLDLRDCENPKGPRVLNGGKFK